MPKRKITSVEEPVSDGNGDESSDYNEVRSANIRRNEEFLRAIGIDDVVAPIKTAVPLKKQPSKTRKERVSVAPTRRSSRVTVERVKAELAELSAKGDEELLAQKQKELEELVAKRTDATYVPDAPAEEPVQRISEKVLLATTIHDEESHIASTVRESLSTMYTTSSRHLLSSAEYRKFLCSMSVPQTHCRKVTPARILSVLLHPYAAKPLVVAGDKLGHIGIWDVNSGEDSVVSVYRPHVAHVHPLTVCADAPQKVFSASIDGTVRCLDLHHEAFILCHTAPGDLFDVRYSDAVWDASGNIAHVATRDGDIEVIDMRSGAREAVGTAHEAKINSIACHPLEEHLLVTAASGKDGCIALHDNRKIAKSWKPLFTLDEHSKSINAAIIAPDGSTMVSVSLDNTIRVWQDFTTRNTVNSFRINHNNHTGRWLSTFRPIFDQQRPNCFLLGSMAHPRQIEVFNINRSKRAIDDTISMRGEYLESVCSRLSMHPTLDFIAGGNSSGKVHVFAGSS